MGLNGGRPEAAAYRPELDGLRAIAVSAVVLYHAAPGVALNGYVGVDVFFVISGFIITTLIRGEIERGRFSLVGFYARRVKRILPALLVVILATSAFAFRVLLPSDYAAFGTSVMAAVLFVGNFYFATRTGYFQESAAELPLLHTWSLGIEEQFYLVWPLLALLALRRLTIPQVTALLAVVLAASFASAVRYAARSPDIGFFLTQCRAWELAAGCMLALNSDRLRPTPAIRGLLGAAGLLGIGAAILLPLPAALGRELPVVVAVAATCAAIASNLNGRSLAGRMLATAVPVWLGKISYSLYLWHWPVFVIARYAKAGPLSASEVAGLALLSLVLAALSWRFVEQPIRRLSTPDWSAQWRAIRRGALASALLLALGGALAKTHGLPQRLPAHVAQIDTYVAEMPAHRQHCFATPEMARHPACAFGAEFAGARQIVLIGDSHANHFAPTLVELAARLGFGGRQMTAASCIPLLEVQTVHVRRPPQFPCEEYRRIVWDYIGRLQRPATIVLAANWAAYVRGARAADLRAGRVSIYLTLGDEDPVRSPEHSLEVFASRLELTLQRLTGLGHRVVVMGQVPDFGDPPHLCVARSWMRRASPIAVCEADRAPMDAHVGPTDRAISAAVGRFAGARFVRTMDAFCTRERCGPLLNGQVAFRDGQHMNPMGARELAYALSAALASALGFAP